MDGCREDKKWLEGPHGWENWANNYQIYKYKLLQWANKCQSNEWDRNQGVECQVEANTCGLWRALHVCANWITGVKASSTRRLEEQYDIEENIYISITRTVIHKDEVINPGSNQS